MSRALDEESDPNTIWKCAIRPCNYEASYSEFSGAENSKCPKCGSADIFPRDDGRWPIQYGWRCASCDYKREEKKFFRKSGRYVCPDCGSTNIKKIEASQRE